MPGTRKVKRGWHLPQGVLLLQGYLAAQRLPMLGGMARPHDYPTETVLGLYGYPSTVGP